MKWSMPRWIKQLNPKAQKIIVAITGGIVLLIGIALLFLPGPAFLVIPAGLAILATQFQWARRWLQKAKAWAHKKRVAIKHRMKR